MTVDASFQVRKLPPSHVTQLSLILEFSEQWKKLMAVIPDKLSKDSFECCISCSNPAKYNADHIRLIEVASLKYKRSGTEIFLEEWGCSGRILPTVGHLLHLLSKAELYRAADYVSERILCRTSTKRPSMGPAAKIPLQMNGIIEENLQDMKYSSSLIENVNFSSVNNNLDYDNKRPFIPPIIITPDADELVQNPMSITNNAAVSLPDLIAFSEESLMADSPTNNAFSVDKSEYNISEPDIPLLSCLLDNSIAKSDTTKEQEQTTVDSNQNFTSSGRSLSQSDLQSGDDILPALSDLNQCEDSGGMTENSENFLPKLDEMGTTDENNDFLPNLSGLNQVVCSSNSISEVKSQNDVQVDISLGKNQNLLNEDNKLISEDIDLSDNLPDISGLVKFPTEDKISSECVEIEEINSSENYNSSTTFTTDISTSSSNMLLTDSNRLTVNTFDSTKSRKCNSPLPNLTLTTHLPHFAYEKLKASTNEFNEDIFEGFNKKGRLLGSGAFGKVFLATGLSQEPVAVKKIILGNVEVVDVNDRVTKQFINEVEVLSRFKHKNLVLLLGFSCDGCTYCLLYEYMPGGTLKDRLQNKELTLAWQERLSIAMGTANAITYLHTAFSSPMIHRDVKTANILLDQSNKPKLGDFGITTLLDCKNTNTCTVIGTSAYMAPEAMRGDISVKCDTFSFGVVLLELLTSLPPYDESREGRDLVTHVEENCENTIAPLLDTSVGSWTISDVNFGEEIYSIAVQCLEEKKKRPVMVDVSEMLMITVSKL